MIFLAGKECYQYFPGNICLAGWKAPWSGFIEVAASHASRRCQRIWVSPFRHAEIWGNAIINVREALINPSVRPELVEGRFTNMISFSLFRSWFDRLSTNGINQCFPSSLKFDIGFDINKICLRSQKKLQGKYSQAYRDSAENTAFIAALIARRVPSIPHNIAHTAGLFHDSRIPMMMARFSDYKNALRIAQAAEGKTITIWKFS